VTGCVGASVYLCICVSVCLYVDSGNSGTATSFEKYSCRCRSLKKQADTDTVDCIALQ
jgi:hypothetical protein